MRSVHPFLEPTTWSFFNPNQVVLCLNLNNLDYSVRVEVTQYMYFGIYIGKHDLLHHPWYVGLKCNFFNWGPGQVWCFKGVLSALQRTNSCCMSWPVSNYSFCHNGPRKKKKKPVFNVSMLKMMKMMKWVAIVLPVLSQGPSLYCCCSDKLIHGNN